MIQIDSADVLIVGAGQAGAQAAAGLRQAGFTGSIVLLGDEPDLPYERPPLSKAYLAGEIEAQRMALRPAAFWDDHHITLLTNRRVETLDAGAQFVGFSDNSKIAYGQLIWAAGGMPRPLTCAGSELAGVHLVRNRQHVDALRVDLTEAENVAIIGGGYIGLETASVLAKSGKKATVLEAQSRLLARVAGPVVSAFFAAEHRAHNVDVRLNSTLLALGGENGRIERVLLDDTTAIPADVVIVGIGLIPEIAVLVKAGAECGNGVEVDEYCRTTLPNVFAVGDCAARINSFADGARVRLESVQNAIEHATIVAAFISGTANTERPAPWFWSNQYEVRLQTVGLNLNFDEEVLRGDPASRKFSVIYLRKGKVVALDCINATKDFALGKQLISRGTDIPISVWADPESDLRQFIA